MMDVKLTNALSKLADALTALVEALAQKVKEKK